MTHSTIETLWTVLVTVHTPLLTRTVSDNEPHPGTLERAIPHIAGTVDALIGKTCILYCQHSSTVDHIIPVSHVIVISIVLPGHIPLLVAQELHTEVNRLSFVGSHCQVSWYKICSGEVIDHCDRLKWGNFLSGFAVKDTNIIQFPKVSGHRLLVPGLMHFKIWLLGEYEDFVVSHDVQLNLGRAALAIDTRDGEVIDTGDLCCGDHSQVDHSI